MMVSNVEAEVSTPTKDNVVAMAARLSLTSKVSGSFNILTVMNYELRKLHYLLSAHGKFHLFESSP